MKPTDDADEVAREDAAMVARWRPFRLLDRGGKVALQSLDADGDFVDVATFVDSGEDLLAFPSELLRQEAGDHADLVAYRHLRQWDDDKAAWGRRHCADRTPLPGCLVPLVRRGDEWVRRTD